MRSHCAVLIGLLLTASTSQAQPRAPLVLENHGAHLELDHAGTIRSLRLEPGRELLAQSNSPLMLLQIAKAWHASSALDWEQQGQAYRLRVAFAGTSVVARATIRPRPGYFEIQTLGLEGPGAEQVARWVYWNVPSAVTASVGTWLNVTSDDQAALAVLALDERTEASGAPLLRAACLARLGLTGRRAALVACPAAGLLPLVERIETEHNLPRPTIDGQWAKRAAETRRSWLITGLSAAGTPPAYSPERAFEAAQQLGAHQVIIALGWWNASLGSYPLNKKKFPQGVESLRVVARQAHARGLKLGLHVMTRSITKNDPLVTPIPHPHLAKDAQATLAADVDATTVDLPTVAAPAGFGLAEGYWAYGGMDVQIDDEIVHYTALSQTPPYGLKACRRGAYATKAAPHKSGVRIQHITERYGWYVADAELGAEIGRRLGELVTQAELDAICFDGADVCAEPDLRFFEGHQVAQGLWRHARRDVMLFSNGSTHFGWHLMARGGEEDSMARGYQGWVDYRIVGGWADYHRRNFMPPDLAWVGIFGATPTMWAVRPDDIELVSARSMALDGSIGWALAGCFGGPSSLVEWQRNGRREEIAGVASQYEKLRLEGYFPLPERRPLSKCGSHWRLLPPDRAHPRSRLVPAEYVRGPIVDGEARPLAVKNPFAAQPLRLRIEALPALAPYGAPENRVLADFSRLDFTASGSAAARATFKRTDQVHAQAGLVAHLSCFGPAANSKFPSKLGGHGELAWAQATAELPVKLDLRHHRALGLWIHGDGSRAVLNVQVMANRQSYLHYYQPIDFTGWKYCELGEPEGDRVMDYFHYEKFALHDTRLDAISSVTLMILNPPRGKPIDLLLGRIEALAELGGRLSQPRIQLGQQELRLPAELESGQYLETGDLWGTRDPQVLRTFDSHGGPMSRIRLSPVPTLSAGAATLRLGWSGHPSARAKLTVMLLGDK